MEAMLTDGGVAAEALGEVGLDFLVDLDAPL